MCVAVAGTCVCVDCISVATCAGRIIVAVYGI